MKKSRSMFYTDRTMKVLFYSEIFAVLHTDRTMKVLFYSKIFAY